MGNCPRVGVGCATSPTIRGSPPSIIRAGVLWQTHMRLELKLIACLVNVRRPVVAALPVARRGERPHLSMYQTWRQHKQSCARCGEQPITLQLCAAHQQEYPNHTNKSTLEVPSGFHVYVCNWRHELASHIALVRPRTTIINVLNHLAWPTI